VNADTASEPMTLYLIVGVGVAIVIVLVTMMMKRKVAYELMLVFADGGSNPPGATTISL